MPSPVRRLDVPAPPGDAAVDSELGSLQAVSAAVEAGAGLFEIVRAAGRALGASLALLDPDGAVLALAARSPAEERVLIDGGSGVQDIELRVSDREVGRLHLRPHADPPSSAVLALVRTLVASEVERVRAPGRASEEAAAAFMHALLQRRFGDREELLGRAAELGLKLDQGGCVVVVHAHPLVPSDEDWRRRVLAIADRAAHSATSATIAAPAERADAHAGEVVVLVADRAQDAARRVAQTVLRDLDGNFQGFTFAVGRSRVAGDPLELHRAGKEALLAANVAIANGDPEVLAFEDMGAYRLLLSEDPEELQRFYADTVAPLVAYDEQYETGLVPTLETFLECDASVAQSAQRLFTHRHTIRYRLERVRELSGLDVGSSDGRERLSLGLKAMRVLGIAAPRGPATEAGAAARRGPGGPQDHAR